MTRKSTSILAERVRALRCRHCGAKGKRRFAQLLGLSLADYARYECDTVPPDGLLARMCAVTGEDLQWLRTGVNSSGKAAAKPGAAHHDVLTRLRTLLQERPEAASAIEAYLDLLTDTEPASADATPPPSTGRSEELIPILAADELSPTLLNDAARRTGRFRRAFLPEQATETRRAAVELHEPWSEDPANNRRTADVVTLRFTNGRRHQYLDSAEITRRFPSALGVRLTGDEMRPMLRTGDTAVVAADFEPLLGQPVLCRLADEPRPRCGLWLGGDDETVELGRFAEATVEHVPRKRLLWSLPILLRVPGRARGRGAYRWRHVALLAGLVLLLAAGALTWTATRRPAWYQPAAVDPGRLHDDKGALAALMDEIGAALNGGRNVAFELREDQVNRWIAARAEMWPGAPADLGPLSDPQVLFLGDRIRIAATVAHGGVRTVVSLTGRIKVTPDSLWIECESARLGALPVPREWVAKWAAQMSLVAKYLVIRPDGDRTVSLANEWLWPNGRRRCRLGELQVLNGVARVVLEPLRGGP